MLALPIFSAGLGEECVNGLIIDRPFETLSQSDIARWWAENSGVKLYVDCAVIHDEAQPQVGQGIFINLIQSLYMSLFSAWRPFMLDVELLLAFALK